MKFRIFSLITLVAFPVCFAQQRMPRRQGSSGSRQTGNARDKNAENVLPYFVGILKSIDKKFFFLEAQDGNTIKFNIVKKTAYFDGMKKLKASEFKEGDPITVEGQFAPDRSFDAVNVRVNKTETVRLDGGPTLK